MQPAQPLTVRAAAPSRDRGLLAAIVCGGLIMGLALGTRHVQGLFLVPMTMDRGFTREAFGLAIAVQNLAWGVAQPLTGMLADRFGSARVLVAGAALYAVGLAWMAHATSAAALTASAGVAIGLALSGTAFGTVYGAISRLASDASRSWALGLAGAIGGLGQFLLVPATQALQDALGWSAALLVLAALIGASGLGAGRLDDRPAGGAASGAPAMAAAIAQAMRSRGFWLLNAGFLTCGFQLAFIATHLPAYLLDLGLPARVGVGALAAIALANVIGTYLCGWLGGRYPRKYLLAGVYLLRSAAMAAFVLAPPSAPAVYLFGFAMGLLWLGTVPLTNGLVSQLFGVRYIATLFGFVFLGHQLGSFLGVWLGGQVFDATRSYDLVWLGAVLLGVVAAALHVAIDDRPAADHPPAGRPRGRHCTGAASAN